MKSVYSFFSNLTPKPTRRLSPGATVMTYADAGNHQVPIGPAILVTHIDTERYPGIPETSIIRSPGYIYERWAVESLDRVIRRQEEIPLTAEVVSIQDSAPDSILFAVPRVSEEGFEDAYTGAVYVWFATRMLDTAGSVLWIGGEKVGEPNLDISVLRPLAAALIEWTVQVTERIDEEDEEGADMAFLLGGIASLAGDLVRRLDAGETSPWGLYCVTDAIAQSGQDLACVIGLVDEDSIHRGEE